MNTELSVKTAVCSKYETLLAWKIWNERRAAIRQSGVQGKKVDDELRNLQARYAKAFSILRNHVRDCPTCQWVSRRKEHSPENDSSAISDQRLFA